MMFRPVVAGHATGDPAAEQEVPVVREAVDSLVGFAHVARLLGDRTIVDHNQPWLDTMLAA
jgi:hypothetical protein